MAAIDLYKFNTAGHPIGIGQKLLGYYRTRGGLLIAMCSGNISRDEPLNDCFNCDVQHGFLLNRAIVQGGSDAQRPDEWLESGILCAESFTNPLISKVAS
jgi:hypothetical protein